MLPCLWYGRGRDVRGDGEPTQFSRFPLRRRLHRFRAVRDLRKKQRCGHENHTAEVSPDHKLASSCPTSCSSPTRCKQIFDPRRLKSVPDTNHNSPGTPVLRATRRDSRRTAAMADCHSLTPFYPVFLRPAAIPLTVMCSARSVDSAA